MTDINTATLRDLNLSSETAVVIDELAAIEMLLPKTDDDLERHAMLFDRLPPLLDLRDRALVHAEQYARFLALAEADPSALEERVDTGNALAILAHAGEIAMLLVPAISPEDRVAHAMLARERDEQYRSGRGVHTTELMMRALQRHRTSDIMGLTRDGRVPPEHRETATRFRGEVYGHALEGARTAPSSYRLEDALALEAWFNQPPDLAALLNEAKTHLRSVDAWSEPDEAGPYWYGATRGALVLAYAKLCQVGLWPARNTDDLVAKLDAERLICERNCDPDHMRALVEIALGVGRRIAWQGAPFISALSGVEL
ncbi:MULTISPECIES: hypothetical protein [Hyphomicrobiales]|jgi:hypothetical protein|uniref:hypothetical protein n=1 Tax=Methylobacterium sp. CCH7-A2 TaxID=1768789 RepID=UPI00082B4B07|nr:MULTISPECIES: hypothetical protein [Hyphomicrobiales]